MSCKLYSHIAIVFEYWCYKYHKYTAGTYSSSCSAWWAAAAASWTMCWKLPKYFKNSYIIRHERNLPKNYHCKKCKLIVQVISIYFKQDEDAVMALDNSSSCCMCCKKFVLNFHIVTNKNFIINRFYRKCWYLVPIVPYHTTGFMIQSPLNIINYKTITLTLIWSIGLGCFLAEGEAGLLTALLLEHPAEAEDTLLLGILFGERW